MKCSKDDHSSPYYTASHTHTDIPIRSNLSDKATIIGQVTWHIMKGNKCNDSKYKNKDNICHTEISGGKQKDIIAFSLH